MLCGREEKDLVERLTTLERRHSSGLGDEIKDGAFLCYGDFVGEFDQKSVELRIKRNER